MLFWLAVVVAALGCAVGASAAGSQPEPSIKVDPDEARPGETVTVIGECWGGCADQSPVADVVTLTLLDGEDELPDFQEIVVKLDPDDDGSFEEKIELPDDLAKGQRYKVSAESPDGLSATDKLFVGGRASSDDGGGGDDNGGDNDDSDDEEGDEPDRASAEPEDCQAPALTAEPPAQAAVETQAPATAPALTAEPPPQAAVETQTPATDAQATATGEADQADDCDSGAPPPSTAPAGPAVLGESESSSGSNRNSSSGSSDTSDSGDTGDDGADDEGDNGGGGGKGKRALKNADEDSSKEEDQDSGGAGAGKGNGRGQNDAAAAGPPAETVRVAAGPAPEDIRESVPWAMIGVLGALFALGLGATYHVGRWAPDPADVG